MNHIVIIGGGISGRLVAFNLLRQAPADLPLHIRLIERGDADYMGPAYSTHSNVLLLNVPAGIMGAFSENQEHFVKWARENGYRAESGDFLPRKLFHDYFFSLMQDEIQKRASTVNFQVICGEAIDVEINGKRATVRLKNQSFVCDHVVLALGNFLPRQPAIVHSSALESARYIRNPWDANVLDSLSSDAPVVFIGTGQTTVDLILLLHERGHQGKITAISRRGLLPLAHRQHKEYPSFYEEIKESTNIFHIFKVVRKHAKRAAQMEIEEQAVIDSLRSHTQEIWSRLPDREKHRFMRHIFRYWERIRSRIPPENESVINELLNTGQLEIVAGHVDDMVDEDTAIAIVYTPRRRSTQEVIRAALAINCIGPETNYLKVDHPLVENLLRRGSICPGPGHIGMKTRANGAIINQAGETSDVLFTLGSTMKGLLWESIAVPEIREQAEHLATLLLSRCS